MKNKGRIKPDYKALERKIFIKLTLISVSAFIGVVLLRSLSNNRLGNFTVSVLQGVFGMDYENAMMFYHNNIRLNMDYIIYASATILLIFLSRFLLSQV